MVHLMHTVRGVASKHTPGIGNKVKFACLAGVSACLVASCSCFAALAGQPAAGAITQSGGGTVAGAGSPVSLASGSRAAGGGNGGGAVGWEGWLRQLAAHPLWRLTTKQYSMN
jgi:hypothetical protein